MGYAALVRTLPSEHGTTSTLRGDSVRGDVWKRLDYKGWDPPVPCRFESYLVAIYARLAQWIRAADYGSAGRGFESLSGCHMPV